MRMISNIDQVYDLEHLKIYNFNFYGYFYKLYNKSLFII